MIYMRLRVDWVVIFLYWTIQIPIEGEKESKGKNNEFNFRLKIDLHFYLNTFLPYFWAFLDPSKWVWTRWATNLNGEDKYLINRTQLSRKNMVENFIGLYLWGLKTKNSDFSILVI